MRNAVLAASLLVLACSNPDRPAIAIVGGTATLPSGERASPSVVIVKGTRILRAGKQGEVAVPAGSEKVDAYGKFVVSDVGAGLAPGAVANLKIYPSDPAGGGIVPAEKILREGEWVQH